MTSGQRVAGGQIVGSIVGGQVGGSVHLYCCQSGTVSDYCTIHSQQMSLLVSEVNAIDIPV